MQDAWHRQVTVDVCLHPHPGEFVALASSPQDAGPALFHLLSGRGQGWAIRRDCEVREVPAQHGFEPSALFAARCVPAIPQSVLDRVQRGVSAFGLCRATWLEVLTV